MKSVLLVFQILICNIFILNLLSEKGKEKKFRLSKYNAIWEKAEAVVPKHKIDRLAAILKKLDKEELHIKHQKHEATGYSKDHEASLQSYLHQVILDYGLIHPDSVNYSELKFQDERLQTLWHKAVHNADYTREDLAALKEEFEHIEQKLKQTKDMHEQIENHEKTFDQKTPAGDIKRMKHLRKDFKNSHHEVNEMLDKMENEVESRNMYFGDNREKILTDKRAVELWYIAKNSGKFSQKELESIKEELKHFQTRVHKLNYWERVSDDIRNRLKNGVSSDVLNEEYEHSKKQIMEHTKFIRKYHATMKERVKSEL